MLVGESRGMSRRGSYEWKQHKALECVVGGLGVKVV